MNNTLNTRNKTLHIAKATPLGNLIEDEVTDTASYDHFKSLILKSPNLCKSEKSTSRGKTLKSYKVHVATHNTYNALLKGNHHKIIYLHDNNEVKAYISIKLYKKTGGFLFIHKLCSSAPGLGSYLMNKILTYAKKNTEKLNITYMSVSTHNLELIPYYEKFKPTFTHIVSRPGSKAKNPPKGAYIIWKLSESMPIYTYK